MSAAPRRAVQADGCVVVEPASDAAAPDDDALALMAKAIAHPARVKIIRVLAERRTCVTGDVVAELDLAQSTVSEHLRILREAGLVSGEIEGPRTRYCVNLGGLAALERGVAQLWGRTTSNSARAQKGTR